MPMTMLASFRRLALAAGVLAAALPALADAPVFHSALDDKPLNLALRPDETLTEGLKRFYATGVNPYTHDEDALEDGKSLYTSNCQICHNAGAIGRMCPSLIGDAHLNARAGTDAGKFEIVFGGAHGLMRSFADRLTQDEILRVTAYVISLKK